MPTENRSSNTEMVSELLPCPFCGQQDFLIERLDSDASVVICQGLTGPHEACLARGPVGVAQDEGEEQPGRDKAVELWNVRAEQHQGEPVAWADPKDLIEDGYGHSFGVSSSQYPGRVPLYTRPVTADPGEVERLSQIIRDLNDERDEIGAEAGRLRAQLAGRDALLHRWVGNFGHLGGCATPLRDETKAALSASAEQQVKS